jgi:protein-disulfide isomerase
MTDEPTPTKRERREAARAQRLEREQAVAAGEARRKRLIQLGGLLALAAVVVVVAILVSSGGDKKASPTAGGALQGVAESRALLDGIPQRGVTLGNARAPVTIVEFADPQCPFCKDFTLNDFPEIVRTYVRTGKAKVDLRLLTFIGDDSVKAAKALTAAGRQGRLWTAADILYHNQGEENSGYVTDDFLRQVLTAAGADAAKALAQSDSPAVASELGTAQTLASRYAVDSTPTVLVGPTGGALQKVAGGVPTADGVRQLVDAALAKSGT